MIGGTSLAGGAGTIAGAMLGALVMQSLSCAAGALLWWAVAALWVLAFLLDHLPSVDESTRWQVYAMLSVSALRVLLLQDDVADALEEGRLFAAGLDVFREEPRVPDRLRSAENAVLTPHVGSGTIETRTAMARMVWEEVLRRASGRPPAHRVVV